MKKTLLVLCLTAICQLSNAQYTLTPQRLINDTGEDYIVWEFEGKTQHELYKAVYMVVSSMYVSPQNVISSLDDNSITINGISESAIRGGKNALGKYLMYDVNYTIAIMFKDGKIRINNPVVNRIHQFGLTPDEIFIVGFNVMGMKNGVFNKNEKILLPETKLSIETFFNNYISKIKESIEKQETTDW